MIIALSIMPQYCYCFAGIYVYVPKMVIIHIYVIDVEYGYILSLGYHGRYVIHMIMMRDNVDMNK